MSPDPRSRVRPRTWRKPTAAVAVATAAIASPGPALTAMAVTSELCSPATIFAPGAATAAPASAGGTVAPPAAGVTVAVEAIDTFQSDERPQGGGRTMTAP